MVGAACAAAAPKVAPREVQSPPVAHQGKPPAPPAPSRLLLDDLAVLATGSLPSPAMVESEERVLAGTESLEDFVDAVVADPRFGEEVFPTLLMWTPSWTSKSTYTLEGVKSLGDKTVLSLPWKKRCDPKDALPVHPLVGDEYRGLRLPGFLPADTHVKGRARPLLRRDAISRFWTIPRRPSIAVAALEPHLVRWRQGPGRGRAREREERSRADDRVRRLPRLAHRPSLHDERDGTGRMDRRAALSKMAHRHRSSAWLRAQSRVADPRPRALSAAPRRQRRRTCGHSHDLHCDPLRLPTRAAAQLLRPDVVPKARQHRCQRGEGLLVGCDESSLGRGLENAGIHAGLHQLPRATRLRNAVLLRDAPDLRGADPRSHACNRAASRPLLRQRHS